MKDKLSKNWLKLKSIPLLKSTLFSIRKDDMLNKRTEKPFEVTILESLDSVNVIAITKDEKIVFAKQYRFGIEATTLELPGGMLDEGEDPVEAGVRELEEETGYIGQKVSYIGKTAAHPVFMNANIHHILVEGASRESETNFDDGEYIEVLLIDKKDLRAKMKAGEFNHPHTVAALCRIDL